VATNQVVKNNTKTIAAGNVANGGGWTFAGRTKSYDGEFRADGIANGVYSLQVCATQAGANGNGNKTACDVETITVQCNVAPSGPCYEQPFGEIENNGHISLRSAVATINFKGDFGPEPSVTITGPLGHTITNTVEGSGNSCVYTALWRFDTDANGAATFRGNDGPGTYTFDVVGNGRTLHFTADIGD
jgi:hypothetical protein